MREERNFLFRRDQLPSTPVPFVIFPFHVCFSLSYYQGLIVKLLLDAQANPSICDRFGRRPSGEYSPMISIISSRSI
jgi:hypothetical protein